jgi:phage N-6-adenine-methyltransferase
MPYINKRFESATEEWSTPDSLFRPLLDEFKFDLDVCASPENAKCQRYITKDQDALKRDWTGSCWMNPPYGPRMKDWVKKAYSSAKAGAIVVCLLPARTNANYWHDYCFKGEVRFIKGYPKFGNAKQGLKAPLAIVIFRPTASIGWETP